MAGRRRQFGPADELQYATNDCESQDGANSQDNQDPHYTNSNTSTTSTPVQQHPDAIAWLSTRVNPVGWPEQEAMAAKEQPWRKLWGGPQISKDGRLIIACPKGYEWGSGSGLGGY